MEPLQLTPVHPHTAEFGTPLVHLHPVILVRRPALVPAATSHIDASFTVAVGDADGDTEGFADGSADGDIEGCADGSADGDADGDAEGELVGLWLG